MQPLRDSPEGYFKRLEYLGRPGITEKLRESIKIRIMHQQLQSLN